MATKRPILIWPDPRLYLSSRPVDDSDWGTSLHDLVNDMIETMTAAHGVGLSAIQVGAPLRVFVLDIERKREVYVNPSWMPAEGASKVQVSEGCLSLPNTTLELERWDRVVVEAQDEDGVPFKREAAGLRSQAIQHEYEHLEGGLVVTDLSYMQKEKLRKLIQKVQRVAKKQNKTLSEVVYGW